MVGPDQLRPVGEDVPIIRVGHRAGGGHTVRREWTGPRTGRIQLNSTRSFSNRNLPWASPGRCPPEAVVVPTCHRVRGQIDSAVGYDLNVLRDHRDSCTHERLPWRQYAVALVEEVDERRQ